MRHGLGRQPGLGVLPTAFGGKGVGSTAKCARPMRSQKAPALHQARLCRDHAVQQMEGSKSCRNAFDPRCLKDESNNS